MISIACRVRGFNPDAGLLSRCERIVRRGEARRIRRLGPGTLNIGMNFIAGSEMRRLNRSATRRDTDTDVLSFNFDEPRGRTYFLGEIYVSVDRLRRQAAEYGQTDRSETALLFIHGFLHLLGYDHEEEGRPKAVMEAKQARYHSRAVAQRA